MNINKMEFKLYELLFGMLLIFSIAIGLFSPLLAFYFSLSLLVIFPTFFANRYLRVYLSIFAIICGCIIFSSRGYFLSTSDDFAHYYSAYQELLKGGSIAQYSQGIEFLISLYFKITIILFGELKPTALFFLVSFFSCFTFYVWLEKYGLDQLEGTKKSLCVASCIGFFMFALSTQLMRQMIATPFLLFALSYGLKNKKGIISMILAIGGHLSSLPIYVVLKIFLSENRKKKFITLGLFLFFGLLFSLLLSQLSILFNIPVVGELAAKLQYYNNIADRNSTESGNTFLKYMFVMLVGFWFFGPKNGDLEKIKKFFYLACMSYLFLLPIPLLSSRIFLVMSAVALGYFMFFAFYRISNVYRILLVLYFIVRVVTLGPYYSERMDGFDLWYSYPWYSTEALYYIYAL
ncbi:EpsG family protein [Serratia proteamaculans]|uniref:EpsG family protein n=1 Tax=Serratia proteamaculans TaxID=28151 RepID=A0A7U0RNU4_SERPR|nr:EpsG family protein [Serratia proteamaculans]MBO1500796.1 EpsG family protein [Serratia proteamaculans]MDW5510147.1 EpsG family protein [Serratia proteamaculans]QQX53837.1 EpsG family protein [Serratia proteamaculans]